MFRIKICGITRPDQGVAIAQLGATALGFICVSKSPRFVTPEQIRAVVEALPRSAQGMPDVDRIGVFVNASVADIVQTVAIAGLNGVQLHGDESPAFCRQLRAALEAAPEVKTDIELIKAFRIRAAADLDSLQAYDHPHAFSESSKSSECKDHNSNVRPGNCIDALLLDAYHPHLFGGTGRTLDWQTLKTFRPQHPWFLAGGLHPDNIQAALTQLSPDGIDLSSGVEHAPGNKDLTQVARLFEQLAVLQR